jgi:hypothetical protein
VVAIGTATGSGVVAAAPSCSAGAAVSAAESFAAGSSEACVASDLAGSSFEVTGLALARGSRHVYAKPVPARRWNWRRDRRTFRCLSAAAASRDRLTSAAAAAASSSGVARHCASARVIDVRERCRQRRETVVSGHWSDSDLGAAPEKTLMLDLWFEHGISAMELQRYQRRPGHPGIKKSIFTVLTRAGCAAAAARSLFLPGGKICRWAPRAKRLGVIASREYGLY